LRTTTFAPVFGRTARLGAAVLVLFMLAGGACKKTQTQTTIPATWRNPEFTGGPFTKIFVMGVGRNDAYRRLYEDSMVRALEGEGTTAHASWTLFPENDQLDKAKVLIAVNEQEFDAVVIARLRSVYEEEEYVPGKPLTSSDLYMSGYNEAYAVNRDPGYYKTNTTYRVETALYSARDEMVAWVVLSDTVNPNSVEEVIQSVSSSIAKRMKAEGLIH
jgi:hypothetical protein